MLTIFLPTRSNEAHVSQMGVKSVEDEDIDIAMKLVHVDIYERALREEVGQTQLFLEVVF